mgnify:FL=1
MGYITVLPGAFSAYRYRALLNDSLGRGPLNSYFKGEHLAGHDADVFVRRKSPGALRCRTSSLLAADFKHVLGGGSDPVLGARGEEQRELGPQIRQSALPTSLHRT